MTTTPEEVGFEKGASLVSQLMAASAADLAHTTNLIEEGLRRDRRELCEEILALGAVLDEAMVIDRVTQQGIDRFESLFMRAEMILESEVQR